MPGVQARTFHSAALQQLRYFWPRAVGGTFWPVLEQKLRLVAIAARRAGAGTDAATLRDLAGEIEWAKASLAGPDTYGALAARAPAGRRRCRPRRWPRCSPSTSRPNSEAEQLDFDDLLLHTCAVLETDDDVAREFRGRYRCFVVDEYQDVTPLQQRLLDAWLGERDQLTVVGDANQTIYSFAGASPSYLLDFERRYPNASVVRLERDYRSTPQVVSLANRIIAAATGATARCRLRLTAVLPDGPEATFAEHPDEPAEAAAVAAQAAALIAGGTPAASIAVLYRINAQSEVYEDALHRRRRAVRGPRRRAVLRPARGAPGDRRAAHRGEPGGPGGSARRRRRRRSRGGIGGWCRRCARCWPASACPTTRRRRRAAGPLGLTAVGWSASPRNWPTPTAAAGLAAMVAELDQRAEAQHAPTADGVTLASLHAAKGLEWDAVFLVGLIDGTLPIQHAETPEAVEEERRLFYVGVTRAKQRLALSWALSRTEGGRRSRRRSRFLTGLAPDTAPIGRAAPTGRCRICGGRLEAPGQIKTGRCARCPSTADPALVDALKDWRRRKSAEDSVPAFVVFSDATLLAIAERRPDRRPGAAGHPGHRSEQAGQVRRRCHRDRQHDPLTAKTVAGQRLSRTDRIRRSIARTEKNLEKFRKSGCPRAAARSTL